MDKATGSGSGRDNSTSDHDCEGRGHPDSGLHTIIKVNWKVPRALKRIVNTQEFDAANYTKRCCRRCSKMNKR